MILSVWITIEGKSTEITRIIPVGGCCINRANRYETDAGPFFVKTNRILNSWSMIFYIKTVKLAGLLHAIGHGPFSHMFERGFLPQFLNGSSWSHEDMSIKRGAWPECYV